MNEQFALERYPELAGPEVARLLECASVVERVTGSPVETFFVCNEMREEEPRWARLWFLMQSGAIVEFDSFLRGSRFDWVPSTARARRIEWGYENYDFIEAGQDSRLRVEVALGGTDLGGLSASFTAVGTNCDRLWEFVRTTWPFRPAPEG